MPVEQQFTLAGWVGRKRLMDTIRRQQNFRSLSDFGSQLILIDLHLPDAVSAMRLLANYE